MKTTSSAGSSDGPGKICAIFPGALGDFICFLPALQKLRSTRQVDLYARCEFRDLLPDGVAVRSIEAVEIGELFQSISGPMRAASCLQSYDAVYSWHGSGNPEFVRRLQMITGGRSQCFPFRPARAVAHQADYYAGCVGAEGATFTPASILLRDEAIGWREHFLTEHALNARPLLAIAPGSGAREKNWPAQSFSAVVKWWRRTIGGEVLLLVGPVEHDRGGLDLLMSDCIVADQLSLAQIAAILVRSLVYLGNDSGISHLAGALGVPTVALFGPSDPLQWAPRGKKVIVLRRGLDCSPCAEAITKSCPQRACLNEFPVPEVISAIGGFPEVIILTRSEAGITV